MSSSRAELKSLVAQELSQPVAPAILGVAEAVRARHGQAAVAVLFYGSCLRKPETLLGDALLDFYLLVDDYRTAYDRGLMAFANRLLPPNVFYLEVPQADGTLRCKYAVLTLEHFVAGTSRDALNVSLWARFSQPARLLWSRDPAIADRVAESCVEAILTMLGNAAPLAASSADAELLWRRAFAATYAAELRSETSDRAAELVRLDLARYHRVTGPALELLRDSGRAVSAEEGAKLWRKRRRVGKLLNLARLVKAAFTFQGALDYVLWKVRRHSGVELQVTDWQRRHPLLSAPALAWKLYRRGAFR